MSEKDEGIKVVDRRRVDEEGTERETPAATETAAPAAPAAAPAENPAPPPSTGSAHGTIQIDFSAFIQSLGQQALMHLGMLPHPESGERKREMEAARQTIDILQMLHEKTKGNLTEDEKQLFEALLHDLRLVFVQVTTNK